MKTISSISLFAALSLGLVSTGFTQHRSGEEDIEAALLGEMYHKRARTELVEGDTAQPPVDRGEMDIQDEQPLPATEPMEREAIENGDHDNNAELNFRVSQHSFGRLNNRASTDDDFSRRVRPRVINHREVANPNADNLPLQNPEIIEEHTFRFGGREFAAHFGFGSQQP